MKIFQLLNEKFFENNPYSYINNINSFQNYITDKGITEENLLTFLRGLRTEDIIESLEYYIFKNDVTSKGTARKYSTAIKEYIYFMLDSETLDNTELLKEIERPGYKASSYRSKMNTFIAENKLLKESEGFEVLSTEDVRDLITQCNILLDSVEEFRKAFTSKKYFNKYRSATIIKLIILTGATYRTLLSLKRNDLDIDHGTITINEFEIHLPKSLHNNFKKYIQLLNSIKPDCENLFIEYEGMAMRDTTSTLYTFMEPLIGRGDLNGIIKYSVIKMIESGINETTIKQVTGVEDKIMKDCHLKIFNHQIAVRQFDSMIRSLEIYDKL